MKQARYSTENAGHFGLASENYTHFTSPIRRYPDLAVHRILKLAMRKEGISEKEKEYLKEILPETAKHSSERERIAMEAERDVVNLFKINFMKEHIDEVYTGYISGVTAFGFFVELEGIFVEGLVHITKLHDDFYVFNEKDHSLIGTNTKKGYRIGDKVTVIVDKIDAERRKIDFSLVRAKDRKNKKAAEK